MPEISIKQLIERSGKLTIDHTLHEYHEEHRLAAVLILVYPGKHEPEIILTKRSNQLSNHAGQISFPGGSIDPGDTDPVHTALREAQEEVALEVNLVNVLGILDVTLLPSGFAVAPVLAVSESSPVLTPNPAEVEEIFSIPLSLACDTANYRKDSLIRGGQRREFLILDYEERYIWGATAKMLHSLAQFLAED